MTLKKYQYEGRRESSKFEKSRHIIFFLICPFNNSKRRGFETLLFVATLFIRIFLIPRNIFQADR